MSVTTTVYKPGQIPAFLPGTGVVYDSGMLAVPGLTQVTFSASVDVIVGGTSPSVTFILEQLQEAEGGAGQWKQLGSWTVNGTGSTGNQVVSLSGTPTIRLRWTVGGAPTAVHFTPSITGQEPGTFA